MRNRNFIVCGLTGWCIEVFFTAITTKDFKGKYNRKLEGHSSIWMFPIYGLASFIGDIYPKIAKWPKLARALLYGFCFMMVEFVSGRLLTRFGVCPWSYDGCRYSVDGVIRLDFFPLWMIAGLLYEHILRKGPDGPFLTYQAIYIWCFIALGNLFSSGRINVFFFAIFATIYFLLLICKEEYLV